MSRSHFLRRFLGAVLVAFIANERNFASAQLSNSEPVASGHKYALLIGCSEYVHINGQNLKGPPNDVRELAEALVSRFNFPANNVRQLVGWPDDVSKRPTHDNIVGQFQSLAKSIEPNSHVVIYMSGHGTRIPIPESQIDPLDPRNPELDGYDEAFVTADARYTSRGIENLILDDKIGLLLDGLRANGSHVWAIFDCCHSGTMARGASDEQSRELNARELGFPNEALLRADTKAGTVTNREKGESRIAELEGLFDSITPGKRPGTLVAFYAAQPFETAPDLPCPVNAPAVPENFFGLLTYTTLQTMLEQRPATNLTYRELGQLVTSRYRAERGSRGPTPTFSGDLDYEVLGFPEWPGRSQWILQKDAETWRVNAGELQGLTTGSILELFPPVVASAEMSRVGHVRVKHATATSAEVEICSHDDFPVMARDKLQELMRCEVVKRHLGDLRLRIAVGSCDPESKRQEEAARKALGQLSDKVSEFVAVCDPQSSTLPEWELCAVTPEMAASQFRWRIAGPRILLTRRGEAPIGRPLVHEGGVSNDEPAPLARAYQSYGSDNEAAFGASLQSDLLKIFTWQNLWRLSGRMGGNLADPSSDVKVELKTIGAPNDNSGGHPLSAPSVAIGQHLELLVTNDSTDKLWITLVFLDTDFAIRVVPTQQLNRPGGEGDAFKSFRFGVSPVQPGNQAWLVIATSAEAERQQPDYTFLTQSALGKTSKEVATLTRASTSPFETLAMSIAGQKGAFRGEGLSPMGKNPTLVIRSWEAVLRSPRTP